MPGKAKKPTNQSITITTARVNQVFITISLPYQWSVAELNMSGWELTPTIRYVVELRCTQLHPSFWMEEGESQVFTKISLKSTKLAHRIINKNVGVSSHSHAFNSANDHL
jgi:hypothetical protein